jgi:hypothetical protein
MASRRIEGSCLCGSVRYQIRGPVLSFRYCHCSRCRKATGSAHASNIFVDPALFRWTAGEELVTRYDLPEAQSFATCFCRPCGSPLPHATRSGKAIVIPAGSLDEDPDSRPGENIFWDHRAPWYLETGDLPRFGEYAPSTSLSR